MKILIVDDEPLARQRLQQLISTIGGHDVVGEADNGGHALELIETLAPNLVLLDIRMPGLDGMAVARQLQKSLKPPLIVFTTAYSEHALDAFGVEAIDYLLKPIRAENLNTTLKRAEDRLKATSTPATNKTPQLRTTSHGIVELIPITEILYAQAESKYITLFLAERELLIEDSLKQLESRYSHYLLRVHRNALVGRDKVRGIVHKQEQHYIQLLGERLGPQISRRHLSEVKKELHDRLY
jgi:two-component system, LytTR family, response regulator AlgR